MGLRLVFDTFPPLSHIYQLSRCCATQVSSETLKKGEGKIGPARRSRPCVLIFLLLLRHFSIPDYSFICSRSLLVAHAQKSTFSFSLSDLFYRLSVVPTFIFLKSLFKSLRVTCVNMCVYERLIACLVRLN